jgi:hypothetical protein
MDLSEVESEFVRWADNQRAGFGGLDQLILEDLEQESQQWIESCLDA